MTGSGRDQRSMEPAALPALRALLLEAGYGVLVRADGWWECFVHRGTERWIGRGLTEDDALRDVVDKLLPSHLGRLLLERHTAAHAASIVDVVTPAEPIEARSTIAET